jgi:hypothetical protein
MLSQDIDSNSKISIMKIDQLVDYEVAAKIDIYDYGMYAIFPAPNDATFLVETAVAIEPPFGKELCVLNRPLLDNILQNNDGIMLMRCCSFEPDGKLNVELSTIKDDVCINKLVWL